MLDKDPLFSTCCDHRVAKMLAYDMLEIYLQQKLQNVEKEDIIETRRASLPDDALLWTGSKRALIELIYALEANGDFNRGNASLKEIAEYFEIIFHIEIGDLYHAYLEMRGRKINRTRYLDTLQKNLLRRMDENDA